ncbi:MAG: SCO family protein [Geminicoccaceae bacterium]
MSRKTLAFGVLLVAAIAAGYAAVRLTGAPHGSSTSEGEVPIGGPFELIDQTGRTVTPKDYAGRLKLMYFGYTYCPDICPTGLALISSAYDLLTPEQQEKVVPIFITVDPERDTQAAMADYVSLFHEDLQGLTGSVEAIESVKSVYRVYAKKAETEDRATTDYLVDHSTFTYLMDGDNRYLTHFSHGTAPEDMAATITRYLE